MTVRRRRWAPAAVIVLALVAVGCGARVTPDFVAERIAAPSEGISASSSPITPTAPVAPYGSSQADPAAGTPPSGGAASAQQPPAAGEDEVVRIILAARCYEPGQVVPVLIEGPPRAAVGLNSAFEGWDQPGPNFVGALDDQGRFEWAVPVPPGTRPGRGFISAGVTGADMGPGGGVDMEEFEVAAAGGC